MIHKDCYAYVCREGHEGCSALDALYCKKEECKFYRNDLDKNDIEKDMKNYYIRNK